MECSDALKELALDLRWSWNHYADEAWAKLDPKLWHLTHNPWVILQTISREQLKRAAADPAFGEIVDGLMKEKRRREQEETWYQHTHAGAVRGIGYFCMEFMLSEALPIYSGGLGNVAGDQLKAASDLGVPVTGVGLLYAQGYFRQRIDKEWNQLAIYPYNDPSQLPIQPLRDSLGEWVRFRIEFPGEGIWVRAWKVQVGRSKLYLLDSNDPANSPFHRGITSELYGGSAEVRLKQEILLGIGGWRLLERLGEAPEVCHMNEGHAAFAVLERARCFMEKTKVSFWEALAATRVGNLFTTHTAVAAGFDSFQPALLQDYLGPYVAKLGVPFETVLALGQNGEEVFNMAHLAIRGSGAVNGVSRLHGSVSRKLFEPLFLRWPTDEVPVGSVTNGVHMPSWDAKEADALWEKHCGEKRWLASTEDLEKKFRMATDEEIWQMRQGQRKTLIDFARDRLYHQLVERSMEPEVLEQAKRMMDDRVLTLGFARRFAPYKRPNLLLSDPERLLNLLTNPERPVQLILAGKAHPADKWGQALLKQWMEFISSCEGARSHVIFLSDYDMLLTENMVQGADVWINTPRRPWEACGTSGMKVLVNGGINLSELDGWWAEAYCPEAGWAIGDGLEHGEEIDAAEARELYDLLEQKVIPEFYNRDERGIPKAWVGRIRESMARYTPHFSTNRTVREYLESYYIPAAEKLRRRTENGAAIAKDIERWKGLLRQNWDKVQFGELRIERGEFEVEVFLGDLSPEMVRVEIFGHGKKPQEMKMARKTAAGFLYRGAPPSNESFSTFTPRIVPRHPEASVPLEACQIRWQR